MMRRFDKDITPVIQAQYFARFELGDEIWSDVNVAARNETTLNSRANELILKLIDPCTNIGSGIIVDPRKEVRSTGDNFHSVRDSEPRHCQGFVQILGAVVYPRKEVAVKIYQSLASAARRFLGLELAPNR